MTVTKKPQSLVTIVESKVVQEIEKTGVAAWCSTNWQAILAELISTCILVLLGCMTCIPIDGLPYQNPLYAALGFGFIVMFNIQIFGHISGAHMNPSVSLAAVLWGRLTVPVAMAYLLAQCAGAVLGYGILTAISPIDMSVGRICVTQLHPGINLYQALGVEIALTAVLNLVNCAVWDPDNPFRADSIPLKFALAVAGLSLAGGPLTGASMNPARSLGPAIWTGAWDVHWVYWIGPLVGGAFGTVTYKYIWLRQKTD